MLMRRSQTQLVRPHLVRKKLALVPLLQPRTRMAWSRDAAAAVAAASAEVVVLAK